MPWIAIGRAGWLVRSASRSVLPWLLGGSQVGVLVGAAVSVGEGGMVLVLVGVLVWVASLDWVLVSWGAIVSV